MTRATPLAAVALALAALAASCSSSPAANVTPTPDASSPEDANTPNDGAALPPADALADDRTLPPTGGCGEFAGDLRFTCAKDGNSRGRCVADASAEVEACPNGCLREKPPADDICMGTTDTLVCPGSYGTVPSQDGNYYITAFGCWVDETGTVHTDPNDGCVPSCLTKAKAAGLCMPGDTGPQCEERVTWFTADGARFGCLAKLRVTNPKTGKALIAVALDFGPACSIEKMVGLEALDASGRVDRYLFGSDQGAVDKSLVHVVQVDDNAALGPLP